MSRTWQWIAPVTAAAGALTTGLLMAALPAQASSTPQVTATVQPGYSVTIAATSPNFPGASHGKVDGYAAVVFGTKPSADHYNKNWHLATISGKVSGAHAGDVAILYAEPFGTSAFISTGQQATLASAGTDSYSFTVQPQRATRYRVEVTTDTTTFDAQSSAQTVYVVLLAVDTNVKTHCSGGHCKITAEFKLLVPAAAYRTESAKHWYFYFDLDTRLPKFPRFLHLDRSATAKKEHKLSAGEFEIAATVPFNSTLAHPQNFALWTYCLKDAESRDGIGLPGHHGCGAAEIRTTSAYVG
jgi:hypothetical protein